MNIPETFGLRRRDPSFEKATDMPMPAVVRPRRLTDGVADDRTALAAVEAALQPDPRPMPNAGDAVVQSFIEMGSNIAAAMRRAGDLCLEQGQRRKDEYYKAAEVAERKAQFQAREAGEFIDSLAAVQGAMEPKAAAVITPALPAGAALSETTQSPHGVTESPAQPEPPKTAA